MHSLTPLNNTSAQKQLQQLTQPKEDDHDNDYNDADIDEENDDEDEEFGSDDGDEYDGIST